MQSIFSCMHLQQGWQGLLVADLDLLLMSMKIDMKVEGRNNDRKHAALVTREDFNIPYIGR